MDLPIPSIETTAEFWLLVDQVLWVALCVSLAWIVMDRARHSREGFGRMIVEMAVLFSAALALRAAMATWGPGDLRLNLVDAMWKTPPSGAYGNAPHGLLNMLLLVLPVRSESLVYVTLVLGSLSVVVTRLLAMELEPGDRIFPWTAALIVALQPVFVRFSGEANRQMYVLFLGATALWAWLRWHRTGRLADAAAAALAATLCVHSRPEVFPLLALLVLATAMRVGGVRRWPASLGILGVIIAFYAVYYWTAFLGAEADHMSYLERLSDTAFFLSPAANIWMDPSFTPSVLIAMLLPALGFGLHGRRRWVLWSALALPGLALLASGMPTGLDDTRQLASARYQTVAVLLTSLLAGYGAARLIGTAKRWGLSASTAVGVGLFVALVSTGWQPFRGVTKPTTLDHEFHLMKEWIPQLPPNAEVFVPIHPSDLGLKWVSFMSITLDREDVVWRDWPEDWTPSSNPQFYWRQASCGMPEFDTGSREAWDYFKACRGDREAFAGDTFLSARIPYRPFIDARTREGSLEVALYVIPKEAGE